jgi:hypothetical protein
MQTVWYRMYVLYCFICFVLIEQRTANNMHRLYKLRLQKRKPKPYDSEYAYSYINNWDIIEINPFLQILNAPVPNKKHLE